MENEQRHLFGCDEESDEGFVAFDDAKGGSLPVTLVREARKVEMQFVKDRDLYEYKPVSECFAKTGHPPVNTKWVDTNKGDDEAPAIRLTCCHGVQKTLETKMVCGDTSH